MCLPDKVLELIAQPVDDQSDAVRCVLWATAYDAHGRPLPESIAHSYESPTELRNFIVSVCSPAQLQFFNFDLLSEHLSHGRRYSLNISEHIAENLGFITTSKNCLEGSQVESPDGSVKSTVLINQSTINAKSKNRILDVLGESFSLRGSPR